MSPSEVLSGLTYLEYLVYYSGNIYAKKIRL